MKRHQWKIVEFCRRRGTTAEALRDYLTGVNRCQHCWRQALTRPTKKVIAGCFLVPEAVVLLAEEAALDKREKKIIFGRFGLYGDGKPKTLEEVGKKFGVTPERIRQLQNRALAKLRRTAAEYGLDRALGN